MTDSPQSKGHRGSKSQNKSKKQCPYKTRAKALLLNTKSSRTLVATC